VNGSNNAISCQGAARRVTIHSMKLAPEPFGLIEAGGKTVEIRLFDMKRRRVMPEDIIMFTCTEGGRTVFARVKEIAVFPTFEELYGYFEPGELGYTRESAGDAKEASPDDMYAYYTPENELKYGVTGIRIEKI